MINTCSKCGKNISVLGNYGNDELPQCYECAHPESINQIKTVNKAKTSIAAAITIGGALLFLGFFHIVTDNFAIIPKDHFTYSMTFVNVDDIVKQYNNQSLSERLKSDALFDHLVKQLENRKMIVTSKPTDLTPDISNDNEQPQNQNNRAESSLDNVPENGNSMLQYSQAAKDSIEQDSDELDNLLKKIPASDTQKPNHKWYIENMQSQIEEKFKPPMGLTDQQDASVTISFTVDENGNISDIVKSRASGIPTLDSCAVAAVKEAAPFGKLPLTFADKKLKPTVTLYYVKKQE